MAVRNLLEAKKFLKIGQRLEISLAGDKDGNFYASRIEDFNDERLVIAMPMEKGYPIIPRANEIIYGRIHTNECIYKFITVFIDKAAEPIPVLKLLMPEHLERHQQRAFVRVDARIALKVSLIDEEKNLLPACSTFTKDISGGGLRFIMDRELPEGSCVHIETEPLANVGVLSLYCQIVRSSRSPASENIFWVGVKFIDLPKNIERNLIRFIFQRQRELLSRRISD